jgi:hypothetical protein
MNSDVTWIPTGISLLSMIASIASAVASTRSAKAANTNAELAAQKLADEQKKYRDANYLGFIANTTIG